MIHPTVELFYDAAWQPATAYDRTEIVARHGRPTAEAGDAPSGFDLELDNRTAIYHPRNAGGALFGKIGRNTPVRVKVGSDVRAAGEASAWKPGRSLDGKDSWVAVEVGGITRRLGQGQPPLQTAPYRYATITGGGGSQADFPPVGYWPLDEGTLADLGAAAVGPNAMSARASVIGSVKPGEGELGPWVGKGVRINGNTAGTPYIEATCAKAAAFGPFGEYALDFLYADGVGVWHGIAYDAVDEVWRVRFDSAAGEISLRVRDAGESSAETTLVTVSSSAASDRRCHHCRLKLEDDTGGFSTYTVYIDGVAVIGPTATARVTTGLAKVRLSGDVVAGSQVNVGHVTAWSRSTLPAPMPEAAKAALGWPGEAAGRRIERLCQEAGVSFTSTGTLDDTAPLGPQHPDPLLEILREAANADHGFLYDRLDAVGLHYRTRRSLENQAAALTLNFASRQVDSRLDAAGDDLPISNDVTVTRRDGASARAVLTTGRLSTAAPPDGVGTYDSSHTLSLAGDGKMIDDQAGWLLHMGTVDEDRFPRLSVNLTRWPSLAAAVTALRIGDRIAVNDLPPHLSVDPLSLIVEGWTETLGNATPRVITFNVAPESPYRVLVYQSGLGSTPHRYDSEGSTLSSGITATATSLSVAVATGHPLWTTDDADDGFDIGIGGERMTVTDISGGASPQTFTVVRSVNGVVKAHSAGAQVRLWQPPTIAL